MLTFVFAKKGQISVFIIVSLLIFIGGFTIFVLRNDEIGMLPFQKNSFEILQYNARNVQNFIQNCLIDVTIPGIFLLGKQGGYIYSHGNIFDTEMDKIAYHFRDSLSSTVYRESMEFELSRYIAEGLLVCIDNFDVFDFNVEDFKRIDVNVGINRNNIEVNVNYPVEVFNDNDRINFNLFNEIFPIRLGHVLEKKDEIVNNIESRQDSLNLDELVSDSLEVNLFIYDATRRIYSIYDLESNFDGTPFIFNFAVELFLNTPPVLNFISSRTLKVGYEFSEQLTAEDSDSEILFFYSKNDVFDVSPTGRLSFRPLSVGEYTDVVCASDSDLGEDCQEVTFWVVS